ncbi:carbohydrate-binding module family 18 protein [Dothidotthia symphoricarpi CBS 119687]|uniref:Carbohydrate-binding module family 18 protein n=1 Tax=Dothidotthia symphoricarpi CBS 119687 TaxID=1392245 RepID=A0A6A5ZVG0_9PLEO|nr:carbohydrate-binding module family 18 protein [Dothidotthia symphoricarpi CBS 119687]KAF2123712.1 carbohydrate-binding module family 18 protein [Dothidotthia symphoricarpi CBS 119687]
MYIGGRPTPQLCEFIPNNMKLTFWLTSPLLAVIPGVSAEVNCRYNVTAPEKVTYYTCTELANTYSISLGKFMLLNPLIDPDCTSIQGSEPYCVAGTVVATTPDGTCKPESYASCLGYTGGQCCNRETWKCGNTKEDCAPGTCVGGLCSVNDPSAYSLDGKCGPATSNLKCGGKWGNCCGKSNTCGNSTNFCGIDNCLYGNCTMSPITSAPASLPSKDPLPFWWYGNTTDGLCGPTNDYKVCNVAWGFCCASSGKCGDEVQFCGTGCQTGYGNCSTPAITLPPTPKPGDISPDGTCGGTNGFICKGSTFGDCCSSSGFCGSTDAHCKAGCQTKFGNCTANNISPDGTCGGTNGYLCTGSTFGNCCSSSGYCGSTTGHCQAGCQSKFGTCTGSSKTSPDGTCGGQNGYTCGGSGFGECCSASGYCGSSTTHCSAGCQATFGTCSSGASKISTDGTCGGTKGMVCPGSGFGDCCSASGYCGSTTTHCAAGCQSTFGTCSSGAGKISTDGTCGGSKSMTCTGSSFGNCCSSAGYCGSTTTHCSTGCQGNFGGCTTSGTTPGNVSPDGTCGGTKKYTCAGSSFGGCCSSGGYCGTTVTHCAQGCQTSFANSCMTGKIPTLDGTCGSKNGGRTCAGGPFDGQCCGASGFCGTTTTHCGTGCLVGYGKCS